MDRARWSKILNQGDTALLEAFASEIEAAYRVELVKKPARSLVMTRARDSVKQQPFYLAEVLVTECTVAVEGVYGFGILMGDRARKAYQLAVVDAAISSRLPSVPSWFLRLAAEERNIEARRQAEQQRMLRTKVSFETMEGSHA